jgi:hypothetical protein
MSTTTKQRTASYKKLLTECSQLREASVASAFRRTTLLCQVFDNDEFRADIHAVDDHAVAEFLDGYVSDLALSFLELRAVLQAFPNEADWQKHGLVELYRQASEARTDRGAAPRTCRRATIRELDKAREEASANKKWAEHLENERKTLADENRELRLEIARLRGRIEELERILERERQ